jgi:hypothetical protein
MSSLSPVSIPFSTDGVELAQKNSAAIPTDARGFVGVGLDGSTLRFQLVDSSGRQILVGAGTAGSPVGGVVSIQGVTSGTPLQITNQKTDTSTVSSVAGSTSTTTILASNTSRLGFTVYNASTKSMYLKLGSAASTSSYSVLLVKDAYWEDPFGYTGIVTAVWDSGVSGNALVTEMT